MSGEGVPFLRAENFDTSHVSGLSSETKQVPGNLQIGALCDFGTGCGCQWLHSSHVSRSSPMVYFSLAFEASGLRLETLKISPAPVTGNIHDKLFLLLRNTLLKCSG
jgi:hypothetical protein